MKGFAVTMDMMFSVFIFLGLLYYLGMVWNSSVQELDRQEEDLLHLRTQQALSNIYGVVGKNHRLRQDYVDDFMSKVAENYTETRAWLGLEGADFKFLIKDFEGLILYETNSTPAGSIVVTSTRYGWMNEPVVLSLWVWRE